MNKTVSDLLNEFIEYKNQIGYALTTAKYASIRKNAPIACKQYK